MLPFARRPRLLVPSGRRASAAAVRRYGEPGSFTAWAGSRALALALAAGAARSAWAGGCGSAPVRAPSAGPGTGTIEAYLRSVLGYEVLISTHLGAASANRKPVLQLLTPRGETAGFAKVSVNPLTRDLIRAERAALDALAAGNLRELTVPRVLHHGQWQGREVLIMNALPVWRRRKALRSGQLTAAMTELTAVGGRSRGPLAGSDYLARLRSRLEASQAGPDRTALGAALDTLAAAGRNSATGPGTATGPAGTWPARPTGCWYGTGSDSPPAFRPASTSCITACSQTSCDVGGRPPKPPRPVSGTPPAASRPSAWRPPRHIW